MSYQVYWLLFADLFSKSNIVLWSNLSRRSSFSVFDNIVMEWESIWISRSISLGVRDRIEYSDGFPELVKDEILGISVEGCDCTVMMVHDSTQKFIFPNSMKERTCTRRFSTNSPVETGCTVCQTYIHPTHVLDTTMQITPGMQLIKANQPPWKFLSKILFRYKSEMFIRFLSKVMSLESWENLLRYFISVKPLHTNT
jgi:hypothetical protein